MTYNGKATESVGVSTILYSPRSHGHSVDHPPGVEVSLECVRVDEPSGDVGGDPSRTLPTGAGVTVFHVHVLGGEVAGGEVKVGTVEGHELGQQHGVDLGVDVGKVVAVHEDAALRRVTVDVHVQEQAGLAFQGLFIE